jgi:predicted ester cyclase
MRRKKPKPPSGYIGLARVPRRGPLFKSLPPSDSVSSTRLLKYDYPVDEPSIGEKTVTRDGAWNLANHWVAAWNGHDLDSIMMHYEDAVELTSPVAAQLLGTSDGKLVGKANLRAYFQRGLEAYPELHFRLEDVLWGVNSVLLYYTNQKGTRTGEFMELSATGKVARVVANYNA